MAVTQAVLLLFGAIAYASAEAGTEVSSDSNDTGVCTGKIVNAAAHLAGAGLQIAMATEHCGHVDDNVPDGSEDERFSPARCAFDVGVSVRSMWGAMRLMSEASGSCGGQGTRCGVAITRSAELLGSVVKFGSNAKMHAKANDLDHARQDLEEMAHALEKSLMAMTDGVVDCKNASTGNATNTSRLQGYCVSEVFSAATTASAAGLEIVAAQSVCRGDDRALCGAMVSNSFMDIMGISTHLTEAAGYCGKGNPDCGLNIEKIFLLASDAAAQGAEAKVYSRANDFDKLREKVTRAGNAVAGVADAIGGAVEACAGGLSHPAVGQGQCVGDSISATTYLADGAMRVAIAFKDCQQMNVHESRARCASDVFKLARAFATTVNDILLAADDCEDGSWTATCGTDVSGALMALTRAGKLSTDARSKMKTTMRDAYQPGESGQIHEENIGDSFEQFSAAMSAATKDCERKSTTGTQLFSAISPVESMGKAVGSMLLFAVLITALLGAGLYLVFRRVRARQYMTISDGVDAEESDEALMGGME